MYAFDDKVKLLEAVEVHCFVNKMPLRNHWHCKTEKNKTASQIVCSIEQSVKRAIRAASKR